MRKIMLSIGTVRHFHKSTYKKIDECFKYNIDGIEILFPTAPTLRNFKLKKEQKNKLQKLKFNTIHLPFYKEKPKQTIYYWNTPYYRKLIEKAYNIAKEINAVNINLHAHQLKNPKVFDGLEDIPYTIENLTFRWNYNINDYKKRLKQNPNLGLLLDISHAMQTKQLNSLIKNFKNKIKFIHLSASKAPKDDHYVLHKFDPKKVKQLEIIKKLKCPVIIEAGKEKDLTTEDIKKEIKFVRKWLNS